MRTSLVIRERHYTYLHRLRATQWKYLEVNQWQRQAQGNLSNWDKQQPHRPFPKRVRFNPESVGITRGTDKHAWNWWFGQQPWLPQTAPVGYKAPKPAGRMPTSTWADDADFREEILRKSDAELRKSIFEQLRVIIFEEAQRDGYELRKVDFEGKATEELPSDDVIKNFVISEDTFRDRVLERLIDEEYQLSPTSLEREELSTIENITEYIIAATTQARAVPNHDVTNAVKEVLAKYPLQPVFGFEHALPVDDKDAMLQQWEKYFHYDWQFGKAVYVPRNEEKKRGNLVWMREEKKFQQLRKFRKFVASGEAWKKKRALIATAAAS